MTNVQHNEKLEAIWLFIGLVRCLGNCCVSLVSESPSAIAGTCLSLLPRTIICGSVHLVFTTDVTYEKSGFENIFRIYSLEGVVVLKERLRVDLPSDSIIFLQQLLGGEKWKAKRIPRLEEPVEPTAVARGC